MTQETEKQPKGTQWLQILVVVIALAIVAYFVMRFVIGFIWWIVAFMVMALLLINRGMVMKVFNYIKGMYKKHTVLGVAGTVGGIIAFTPFIVFLLGKTIWDFRKSGGAKKQADNTIHKGKTPIEMDDEPLYDDSHFNDSHLTDNFPPTNQ